MVQATRMLAGGLPVSDTTLRSCGVAAVGLLVEQDVTGLSLQQIRDVVHLGVRQVSAELHARQLHDFVTAEEGIAVVTVTRHGQRPLAGRITGPYRYDPAGYPGNPHVRDVRWGAYLPPGVEISDRLRRTVFPVNGALVAPLVELAAGLPVPA
ncbi:hypothetical protein CLV35_0369 [Motilibacter peucedani]|uniref:Uncharacterized protein n=2 Tax=Motilibacter peucedani TaxID=598650 RepID=A0A420XSY5_9ACTN|nr:hypothetical protein CLV35_0369 [Motilibacter peucedani]